MPSLRVLSMAGCGMLTADALSQLVQIPTMEELELTNCPGATPSLLRFLSDNMPKTLIIGWWKSHLRLNNNLIIGWWKTHLRWSTTKYYQYVGNPVSHHCLMMTPIFWWLFPSLSAYLHFHWWLLKTFIFAWWRLNYFYCSHKLSIIGHLSWIFDIIHHHLIFSQWNTRRSKRHYNALFWCLF